MDHEKDRHEDRADPQPHLHCPVAHPAPPRLIARARSPPRDRAVALGCQPSMRIPSLSTSARKVLYCVSMKSLAASGLITSITEPRAVICSTKVSLAAASAIHSPHLVATSSGRPSGPAIPVQPTSCRKSGLPRLLAEGASKPGTGSSVVTISGFSCPLATKLASAEELVHRNVAVPLSTAVAAAPPPFCGMWVAFSSGFSTPNSLSTNTAARCRSEPTPDEL